MTMTIEKAKVSLPSDSAVKVTRSFNAPRHRARPRLGIGKLESDP